MAETPKKHHLKGEWASRRIWLDGKELSPGPSQKLINHSPDGFNWGYGGSGPAQLALAVCMVLMPDYWKSHNAPYSYQQFKWAVIAKLPQDSFEAEFYHPLIVTMPDNPNFALNILTHDMEANHG
jgi:hypothetical protein